MNLKKAYPFLISLVVFIIASLLYFYPVLSGKHIKQSDITQFSGMAKEVVEYRNEHNNQEPYWLNNAFSGMPAYQVSTYFQNDFVRYIDKALRFLPRPADYLFLYFLGFFLLLSVLKVNWKLAILGALSFGFSTYLIIIFGAGHNAKAHAIAYMPMVIAGFVLIFKNRLLLGFTLTAIAMSLEVYANHPQMTYYLGFLLLILGIVETFFAFKNNNLKQFVKQVLVILLAVVIGVGVNATRLMSMKEYAGYSTRGKSELTYNPDGSLKKATNGLDKDYITEYSYGKLETINLLIPRFMGGGTIEKLNESSNFYKVLEQNVGVKEAKAYSSQVLTYWGTQPIVEAPAYIGAVLFFLFFLGIFLVDTRIKWWLVSATIFSIILSWGKNFGFLTNFFIDYIPLYNKFRAVSSIQVIAEVSVPLLGFLGLQQFFSPDHSNQQKIEALKKAIISILSLLIIGVLFAMGASTFEGIRDSQYAQLPELIDALIADRKAMLFTDTFRSVVLIVLTFGVLWYVLKNKFKAIVAYSLIATLILFDLVGIDVNYVNKEDFTTKSKVETPFFPNDADKQILEDTSYYRVANFEGNFMNEARTSYFHNSIGGYHAAKMKRYQELFDYQFTDKVQNPEVLNMLNTKYLIVGADRAQLNPDANGNAWFVEQVLYANSADQEMKLLSKIDTKKTAVVKQSNKKPSITIQKDSTATIVLHKFTSNEFVYQSRSNTNQFAVFSEIYYKNGWNAYLDGKLVPHYQTNYVLRGMPIPSGKHTVIFKFEPKVIQQGSVVSLISYGLLCLLPIGWFFFEKKKNEKA